MVLIEIGDTYISCHWRTVCYCQAAATNVNRYTENDFVFCWICEEVEIVILLNLSEVRLFISKLNFSR